MSHTHRRFQRLITNILPLLLILALCPTLGLSQASDDSNWSTTWTPPGIEGSFAEVNALVRDGDSLYVAGSFSKTINGITVSNLAVLQISDASWHDIGYRAGEVKTLAYSEEEDMLYVGGYFTHFDGDTTIQYIVKWDGTDWLPLQEGGDSLDGIVHDIEIRPGFFTDDGNDHIYVAGAFTTVNGIEAKGIARYSAVNGWEDLNSFLHRGSSDPIVYDLDFRFNNLWVGGYFDKVGGDTAANLAVYEVADSVWTVANGGPTNGWIRSLHAFGHNSAYDRVVVTGGFTQINDTIDAEGIALYRSDNGDWSSLGLGLAGGAEDVDAISDDTGEDITIYAGGGFNRSYTDTTVKHLAKWESMGPDAWVPLGGGVSSQVNALLPDLTYDLFVGGAFRFTGDSTVVNRVARYDKFGTWHGFGRAPDGPVTDIYVDENGTEYYCGAFQSIANKNFWSLAVWGDSLWRPDGQIFPSQAPEFVRARGDTIYIAGQLLQIDGQPYEIAMYVGGAWQDLNGGINGPVEAMDFAPGGDLYVAGAFTQINGSEPSQGLARWDGSQWHNVPITLADGENYADINDLAFDSATGDLYVAGGFALFDQILTRYVARWDGSSWHAVDSAGVPTEQDFVQANAVVVDGAGRLFVGGNFEFIGSGDGGPLWMFDGRDWSFAGGLNSCMEVHELITDGCNVYVGGRNYNWNNPGDCAGYGVARFNGAAWIELGSGVRGTVNALALSRWGLMVGGSLSRAGSLTTDLGVWTDLPASGGTPILTIVSPGLGDTLEYGRVHPITFAVDSLEVLQVEYSLDSGKTWTILHHRANADRPLPWLVPDTNAPFCQLRAANGDFACAYVNSQMFSIVADTALESDWMIRYTGQYYEEPFYQTFHNWNWENDRAACWPDTHWQNLSYDTLPWPMGTINDRSRFPDWWMFCDEWEACWIREKKPRVPNLTVFTFWDILSARGWDGSCYGFAISDLLLWRHFDVVDDIILPDTPYVHDLQLNGFWRYIVNKYWSYQFGPKHLAYGLLTFDITPMQTLRILRDSAFASHTYPRVLSMLSLKLPEGPFNWDGVFSQQVHGHTVVPYKISNVPDSAGIYHIFVYDNNFPDDTTTFIRVDSINSLWSYSPPTDDDNLIFEDTCCGLYASLPINEFTNSPLGGRLDKSARDGTVFPHATQFEQDSMSIVLVSAYEDIVLTDQSGNRIGAAGTTLYNDSSKGYPIIPLQPKAAQPRPLGYYLPAGNYTVDLSNLSDSVEFLWRDSTKSYCLLRDSDSTETDRLRIGDGFSYINDDATGKSATLVAIEGDSTDNKYYRIQNMSLQQGDSLQIDPLDDGRLYIGNGGSPKTYNLVLWNGTETGQDFGQILDLTVDSAASQWLTPAWQNLTDSPLVVANDTDGDGAPDDTAFYNVATSADDDTPADLLPDDFRLHQNYPNPFNPSTTIEFSLPTRSEVTLTIYNVLGREVNTLVNRELAAGAHTVEWDGTNRSGVPAATGVYFYRLVTEDYTASKKMLLLK